MTPKSTTQVLHAPSPARERYGLRQPLFNEDALQRADEALEELSGSFAEWLDQEIERLQKARLAAQAAGWTADAIEQIACAAHDLKGVGTTYGYPLVTDIAASLCHMIECAEGQHAAQDDPALVCAHVDAVRAAVRQGVASRAQPVGKALLQALEARVDALGLPRD